MRLALLVAAAAAVMAVSAPLSAQAGDNGRSVRTHSQAPARNMAGTHAQHRISPDVRQSSSRTSSGIVTPRGRYDSEPVGNYSSGCLVNGIQVNGDSPFYQLYHPQNQRHYADISMISFLERYSRKVRQAGIDSVLVGDISSRYGGPFNKGHASHQIGLDVDIEFNHRRLPQSRLTTKGNAQVLVNPGAQTVNSNFNRKYYDMLMIAARDPEVERIFVSPAIKVAVCDMTKDEREQPFLRKIRPWYGHTEHFHIRLRCPDHAHSCVRQDPPEPKFSIAQEREEAMSWFDPPQVRAQNVALAAALDSQRRSASGSSAVSSVLSAAVKPDPKPRKVFPERCSMYYQSLNIPMKAPGSQGKKRRR